MQAEERIKELIIAKYGNVRAFATESGISYTTVRSILERGIMNAKAENVFKICHLLGISPDTVADWGISNEQQPTNAHDIDNIIDNAMMFDGKPLTEDGRLLPSLSNNAVNKTLRKIVGREVRVHSLRHTYASYLIAHDIDLISVSQVLGHENLNITLEVYAHQLQEQKSRNDEKIKQMWTECGQNALKPHG